jgi:hypothetical protein
MAVVVVDTTRHQMAHQVVQAVADVSAQLLAVLLRKEHQAVQLDLVMLVDFFQLHRQQVTHHRQVVAALAQSAVHQQQRIKMVRLVAQELLTLV